MEKMEAMRGLTEAARQPVGERVGGWKRTAHDVDVGLEPGEVLGAEDLGSHAHAGRRPRRAVLVDREELLHALARCQSGLKGVGGHVTSLVGGAGWALREPGPRLRKRLGRRSERIGVAVGRRTCSRSEDGRGGHDGEDETHGDRRHHHPKSLPAILPTIGSATRYSRK